jgi:hypothetical protein
MKRVILLISLVLSVALIGTAQDRGRDLPPPLHNTEIVSDQQSADLYDAQFVTLVDLYDHDTGPAVQHSTTFYTKKEPTEIVAYAGAKDPDRLRHRQRSTILLKDFNNTTRPVLTLLPRIRDRG